MTFERSVSPSGSYFNLLYKSRYRLGGGKNTLKRYSIHETETATGGRRATSFPYKTTKRINSLETSRPDATPLISLPFLAPATNAVEVKSLRYRLGARSFLLPGNPLLINHPVIEYHVQTGPLYGKNVLKRSVRLEVENA